MKEIGEADSSSTDEEKSLLAPFSPEFFVPHESWRSLDQILRGRGGSYGLSGPRGAGKTWMMDAALDRAEKSSGVGVWFPSPSEYEPIAFLAALSDVVATSYERYYDRRNERGTRTARFRFMTRSVAGVTSIYLALVLLVTGFNRKFSTGELFSWLKPRVVTVLGLIIVGAVLIWQARRQFQDARHGLGRVRSEAEELRKQVRFTLSTEEHGEVGVTAGYAGLGAGLKRARDRRLVERPATLSSLVHNFRAFVSEMAAVIDGPVVIAIDELDKMSDPSRVAQLFRDIKGIFEIPGAFFLVSLSDEAARSLDLGAVRTRDEFNSSFYTVITVPPLSPDHALQVLRARAPGFDADPGLAIGVLSGGVAREVIRLAELVRQGGMDPTSAPEAARVILGEELSAFVDQVLETAGGADALCALDDFTRVATLARVEMLFTSLAAEDGSLERAALDSWDLNHNSTGWEDTLAEEWRRLLIRLVVAARIVARSGSVAGEGEELQRVIQTAASSAAAARWRLDPGWRPASATAGRPRRRRFPVISFRSGRETVLGS